MTSPFERLTRKIPAIGVATIVAGRTEIAGYGSIESVTAAHWEIGSITKVFTGVLLAEMCERGEVRLEDPIGRWVPADVAERLPDDQPTLRQLATHTAGLPRLPKGWMRRIKGPDPYSQLSVQDVWDALGPHTVAPSKERFRYSNFGMGLLGHLLERAADTPYAELVRNRITAPLGMADTGVGVGSPVPGFKGRKPTPPWTFGALGPAGAIRSTLDDMVRFARAVLDPPAGTVGTAIARSLEVAFQGRVHSGGLGWLYRLGRPSVVWHNGGTYGASTFLAIDREKGVALIACGNRGPRLMSPLDGTAWKAFDGLGGA